MIIDLILDRKDGLEYNPNEFYSEVMEYGNVWPELANPITRAMDSGTEEDVKTALCGYVDSCGYSENVKDYINSVNWIN